MGSRIGSFVWANTRKERLIGGRDLIKGHRGHHRRIAHGLEVHVASVLRSLQLDHNEMTLAVDGQEVDSATGILPVAELLRDHEKLFVNHFDLIANQAL